MITSYILATETLALQRVDNSNEDIIHGKNELCQ